MGMVGDVDQPYHPGSALEGVREAEHAVDDPGAITLLELQHACREPVDQFSGLEAEISILVLAHVLVADEAIQSARQLRQLRCRLQCLGGAGLRLS